MPEGKKNALKDRHKRRKLLMIKTEVVMVDLNDNLECNWLILTTTVNAIGLLNCAITTNCSKTNCPMITWQVN